MTSFGPPDTFGKVTFCDDIRQEIDGKITLVGCYGADIVVNSTFPVVIPKLGIFVQFWDLLESPREPMRLEILFPGDPDEKPSVVVELPVVETPLVENPEVPNDEDSRRGIGMNMVMSPVAMQSIGRIRVQIKKGDDIYRIGRIKVVNGINTQKSENNP